METIIGKASDNSVIKDKAIFLQHQAVAAAPRRKLEPRIGVDAIEKLGGIRADDFDLAEG